jgi:biotin carboxylase
MTKERRNDMRVLVLGHSNAYADWALENDITLYNVLDSTGIRVKDLMLQHEPLYVSDRTSIGEMLGVIYRRGLQDNIDVLFTNSEAAAVAAAAMTQILGARGVAVRSAVAARDKSFQKGLIRDAGLPVAASAVFGPGELSLDRAAGHVGFPAVVKPLAEAGTLAVARVRDREHLTNVLEAYHEVHKNLGESWLLEHFVDGTELHLDGLIKDGKIEFLSAGRYFKPLLELRHGRLPGSVILDPTRHESDFGRYREFAERALAALGLETTVFHMECFDTAEGIVFSECAARCAGQLILPAIKIMFGIELQRAAFQLAVTGEFDAPTTPVPKGCVGWAQIPVPQGRVTRLPDQGRMHGVPGLIDIVMDVGIGDDMPYPQADLTHRAGAALISGETEEVVEARLAQLIELFVAEAEVTPFVKPPGP